MPSEPMDPIAAMLRSWWIIVASMVTGAAALGTVAYLQPPSWTATAVLQFRPGDPTAALIGGGSGLSGTDADRLLNSQQDVLLSDAVITPAAQSLGLQPAAVRRAVTLERREGSDVLMLSATSDEPKTAAQIATTVVRAYVEAGRSEGVAALNAQADALQTSIAEVVAAATALPPPVEGTPEDPRRAAYASQLAALSQQARQLSAAATLYPGKITVLRVPDTPSEPSSAGAVKGGLVGTSLGLVFGMILALARGVRRRRPIRSRAPLPHTRAWDPAMFHEQAPVASR